MQIESPEIFAGKDVLITGTSKGLGAEIAKTLTELGARVFGVSRTAADWEGDLPAGRRARYLHYRADISDPTQIDELFKFLRASNAQTKFLINNAGYFSQITAFDSVSLTQWNASVATNLTAAFIIIQKALPMLRSSAPSCIINVSSSVAQQITPGWGDYAIAKAGLEVLSKQVSKEHSKDGISAFSVWPRKLRTDMRRRAHPTEDQSKLFDPSVAVPPILNFAAKSLTETIEDVIDLSHYY